MKGVIFKTGQVNTIHHRGYQTRPYNEKVAKAFEGFYPLVVVETISYPDRDCVIDIYIEVDKSYKGQTSRVEGTSSRMRRVTEFGEINHLLDKLDMSRADALFSGEITNNQIKDLVNKHNKVVVRSRGKTMHYDKRN